MATVWIYPPEILPLKIRAKGASLAAAADFLGNFLVVEITPPALKNIGYKTYIIFAVFNIVNAAVVWCFYPETAGQTLESVDRLFIDDWQERDALNDKFSFVKRAQWSMVRKAREVRKNNEFKERNLTALDSGVQKDGSVQEIHAEATDVAS